MDTNFQKINTSDTARLRYGQLYISPFSNEPCGLVAKTMRDVCTVSNISITLGDRIVSIFDLANGYGKATARQLLLLELATCEHASKFEANYVGPLELVHFPNDAFGLAGLIVTIPNGKVTGEWEMTIQPLDGDEWDDWYLYCF